MNFTTLSRRARFGLATLSGILLGLAFPPTGLAGSLLAFVAIVPLFIALESADSLRKTFYTTFVAMFFLGIVSNYWVGGWKSIGEADGWLMMAGVLLAIVHPFWLVVPYLLYDMARRRFGRMAALYLLPIFQAGFEYAHSFGDLSYPWLNLYNTQTYNLSFIQFIEFTGPYALSMVILLVNVQVFQMMRGASFRKNLPHALALLMLIVIPYFIGMHAMGTHEKSAASLRVTVVQPNIDPWAKWNTDDQRVMDTNFSATETALKECHDSTDLVVWPETAITFFITSPAKSDELYRLDNFLTASSDQHFALLTGFPDRQEYERGRDSIPPDAHYTGVGDFYYRSWNAAMLREMRLDTESTKRGDMRIYSPHSSSYHKQKLVPLGEHVPFVEVFPALGRVFQWGVGLGSWNLGEGYEPLLLPLPTQHDTLRVDPEICYESVYPSFIRHFVDHGANLLAVITNDGWYGESSGPYQHEQFAVLRAIENRRYLVRSANTGISTIIDDRGRFVKQLPLFRSGSITERVPLIERKTFYTRFGDFVAIPAMLFSIGILVYAIVTWYASKRRKKSNPSNTEGATLV